MIFKESIYFHFPWQFKSSNVLFGKIKYHNELILDDIRKWVMEQKISNNKSTHWWYYNLPENIKQYFKQIVYSEEITQMFYQKYNDCNIELTVINEMNEIYVSPPTNVKNTSDEVFFTKHIDGPYYYFPFATVYRLIVGMDENEEIKTIFSQVPVDIILKKGDIAAFDFHREPHYIRKTNVANKDFRVVLKIHYCLYNKKLKYFGYILSLLSSNYDRNFRNLFLYTITPETYFQKLAAYNVILWTKIYHSIEIYFGFSNILYISTFGFLSLYLNDFNIFMISTSFNHYIRYISTYHYKTNTVYFAFVRDYILYKFISDVNFLLLYQKHEIPFVFISTNFMLILYLFQNNGIYRYCLGGTLNYLEESISCIVKRYNTYLYNIFVYYFLYLNYNNHERNNTLQLHLLFNILMLVCY